jgi:hypothetical protein
MDRTQAGPWSGVRDHLRRADPLPAGAAFGFVRFRWEHIVPASQEMLDSGRRSRETLLLLQRVAPPFVPIPILGSGRPGARSDTTPDTMSTVLYASVLLAAFALQYACDARCIAHRLRQMHLSASGIRWPALERFLEPSQRCYRVHVRDQHGRVSTRLCRVTGVIGLPMEVALESIRPESRRR